MTKLVELIDVSVHFTHKNGDKSRAMHGVDLCINQGEHIAIVGENGSGKSTLLRVLRGDIYPDQKNGGIVKWYENGQAEHSPLTGREMVSIVSPKIQEYYATQAWNVTCLEIIIAATSNDFILYRKPSQEEIERATILAKTLDVAHLLTKKIHILSQGQLQIILLCRALMRSSPLLLLDEAMNGLDAKSQKLVLDALNNLAESQKENAPTLVFTTHIQPLPNFIEKCYKMQKGELHSFKKINPAVQAETTKTIDRIDTIENSDKNPVKKTITIPASGIDISLINADVYVDHHHILHQINWQILTHEQWAIQGANGSGKSTFLTTLLGFLPVALGGYIKRILYTPSFPQGEHLIELATIKKHIRIVSDKLQTHYTYNDTVEKIIFSGFDGNIGVYRDISPHEQIILETCLTDTNLMPLRHRTLRSLSTGQARQALLARALIANPSLLLLDEPFSGLDEKSRAELTNILEYQIEKGLQTILVSHHPQDFLPSTSHKAFMNQGILSLD